MRRSSNFIGKHVAQILAALALALIVQGAAAADTYECPSCAAHACMHMGCPNGDNGSTCASASNTCQDAIATPLALTADRFIAFHFAPPVSGARIVEPSPTWNTGFVRRVLAPPTAGPSKHIVLCRLRR